MARVEEFLLYSAQCRFMADCSPNPEEKAEWDHLARRWLSEAIEMVEEEASPEGDSRPDPKVEEQAGSAEPSAARSGRTRRAS